MDLIINSVDIRYCEYCGAQIQGPRSWGHDDNCRTRFELAAVSPPTNEPTGADNA